MRSFKRWRRRLTDPLFYIAIRCAMVLVGHCPPRGRRIVARFLGIVMWPLQGAHRRIVQANLRIAFPELSTEERLELGKQCLYNGITDALEFIHLVQNPAGVKARVHLDPAMQETRDGGGAGITLFVIPHLGNWELFGHAASINGVTASAVAQEFRNPYLERLAKRTRTIHGLHIIHAKGAARGIVRAFREGRHVGILMDQNTRPKEGGAYVDFFGLPVTVSRAPAVLARRFNVNVLITTLIRHGDAYTSDTERLPKPVAEYADEHELLQAMMTAIETLVRRHPGHYVWTYRRWRYRPAHVDDALKEAYPFYARAEDTDNMARQR